MKTNGYEVNHVEGTVVMSKNFIKAAGVYGSPEYKILMGLKADLPEYTFSKKEIKKNAAKTTYKNLKYANMEKFIIEFENITEAEKETHPMLKAFNKVKNLSDAQPAPYAYVKSWFLENYPNYKDAKTVNIEAAASAETENIAPKLTAVS